MPSSREVSGRGHGRRETAKVPRRATLVFDGRCGFCTWSVRLIERLDRKRRITAVPYQKPGVPASVGLTVEACKKAAWAATLEGRTPTH
jgi:predicted DCC family thiol-disulfide oxidoreductase YuxK